MSQSRSNWSRAFRLRYLRVIVCVRFAKSNNIKAHRPAVTGTVSRFFRNGSSGFSLNHYPVNPSVYRLVKWRKPKKTNPSSRYSADHGSHQNAETQNLDTEQPKCDTANRQRSKDRTTNCPFEYVFDSDSVSQILPDCSCCLLHNACGLEILSRLRGDSCLFLFFHHRFNNVLGSF